MEGYQFDNPLKALFPKGVITVISDGDGDVAALYPEERAFIIQAVEKRKKEFSAGRLCARKALEALGVENFPILAGEGRYPLLPEGIRASISHAKGCCGVVAFRSKVGGLVGMDIEEKDRLRSDLWSMTFVEEELRWLNANFREEEAIKWATVLFSAKEAFFKYQSPLTHAWVGLRDASVTVDAKNCTFTLTLLESLSPYWDKGTDFQGKYVFFGNYAAAGLCLLEKI